MIEISNDIAHACDQLKRHGLAVVANVLPAEEVKRVKQILFDTAEASERDGVPTRHYAFDPDGNNQRVFHLFNFDPVFAELIQHSAALECVHSVLGQDFLISNFSANITQCGNAPMQLHADQGYVLPPWPETPLACNVAWVLDDFNENNGGTRYVPGSHLRGHGPDPACTYETEAIAAPAGSMMIMDGRLWHQTGANHSPGNTRAALFGYYVLRWLRPQINWNAALWPKTITSASPEFLHRLGFYTGNVEFQVPHGQRASVRAPAELTVDEATSFALAPADRS